MSRLEQAVYRWTDGGLLWRGVYAVEYAVRRFIRDIPMRIAFALPRSVALWAFVRVYGAWGHVGPDYEPVYKHWEAQGKGKGAP